MMIITFVRIMPGPDNPVGTMQTVSIVLPIIIAVLIIRMMMISMTNIRSATLICSADMIFIIKPYKISNRILHFYILRNLLNRLKLTIYHGILDSV